MEGAFHLPQRGKKFLPSRSILREDIDYLQQSQKEPYLDARLQAIQDRTNVETKCTKHKNNP